MSDRPLDPLDDQQLAGLADLPPEDPRVAGSGPRVRAQLQAYRDFVAPGDTPEGARVDDAEQELGRRLEREIGVPMAGAARTVVSHESAREGAGFWSWLLGPRMRPALAVAAIVVVVGGLWLARSGREESPVLRGSTGPTSPGELSTAAVTRSDGSVRLEWLATAGASSYTLVFLSPDLSEIARVSDLHETSFLLNDGALPSGLVPRTPVLWRVQAMSGADELARSKSTAITIP